MIGILVHLIVYSFLSSSSRGIQTVQLFNSSSDLSAQAFCLNPHPSQIFDRYFPLHYPEAHLPWVWDAVHDPVTNVVEITTITRKSCWFNQTIWNRLLTLFPQHARELGGGLLTNILVPADVEDKFDYTGKRPKSNQGLIGKQIQCNFYNANEELMGTTISHVIRVERSFIDNCPIQIKCPTPDHFGWTRVRLERDPAPLIRSGIHLFSKHTEAFPVCKLPVYSPERRPFDLSICAYMFSSKTENLIEWLQYHIALGVDHFFIYNTATTRNQQKMLEAQLRPYILDNTVTLVSWPYMNCMRNMGTGRYLYFYEPSSKGYIRGEELYTHKRSFKPPKKIMQSSAIASCYSRFRWSSTYMAQIDVDEYLTFDRNNNGGSFKSFIKRVFVKFPKAPAIAFRPVMMDDCPEKPLQTAFGRYSLINGTEAGSGLVVVPEQSGSGGLSVLPRLGRWQYGRLGAPFESKLIVRSEAVDDVYVHYISQLASPQWSASDVLYAHPKQAMLLHYKSKGGIIGAFLDPHEKRSRAEVEEAGCRELCRSAASLPMTMDAALQSLMQERIQVIRNRFHSQQTVTQKARLDFTRHGLNLSQIDSLVDGFVKRLNEVNRQVAQFTFTYP